MSTENEDENLLKIDENIFEQYEDEDILSDIRNLFINENDSGPQEEEEVVAEEEEDEAAQELLKGQITAQIPIKPAEQEDRVIYKSSTPPPPPPPQSSSEENPPENKVIFSAPKPQQSDPKCKSNSDCQEDFYCLSKSGKCTEKFAVDTSGCLTDDECVGRDSICFSKTCRLMCNTESSNQICDETAGLGCVEAKGLKGLKGSKRFNGVCDKLKTQSKPISASSGGSRKSSSSSSSNASAVIGGVVLGVFLVAAVIGFIYFRGYLKRKHRNNSPDMFLFDRLQRSTSQSILSVQSTSKPMPDRLNERLSEMGGARFTRWAALSNSEQ